MIYDIPIFINIFSVSMNKDTVAAREKIKDEKGFGTRKWVLSQLCG